MLRNEHNEVRSLVLRVEQRLEPDGRVFLKAGLKGAGHAANGIRNVLATAEVVGDEECHWDAVLTGQVLRHDTFEAGNVERRTRRGSTSAPAKNARCSIATTDGCYRHRRCRLEMYLRS